MQRFIDKKSTNKNDVYKSRYNTTGIPDSMKRKYEQNSGYSLDDVNVHYNSDKPAQINAFAYTYGNQIYVAPNQEENLPHELGHVIQQKQGIVSSNNTVDSMPMNDNKNLENRADRLEALFSRNNYTNKNQNVLNPVIQMRGAFTLSDLLKLHNIIILDEEILALIDKYDKCDEFNYELQNDLLISIKAMAIEKKLSGIIDILSIIDNELYIVGNQKAKKVGEQDTFTKQDDDVLSILDKLLTGETILETDELVTIKKYYIAKSERDDMEAKKILQSIMNYITGEEAFKKVIQLKYIRTEYERLSRSKMLKDIPELVHNAYALLESGSYWKGKGTVQELSDENIMSMETDPMVLVVGKKDVIVKRIEIALLKNTELVHYSTAPSINVLMSQSYGEQSHIRLVTNNSDKEMENKLQNTGFVFCFIEPIGRGRKTSRFGNYRYTVSMSNACEKGIISKSWLMLSDMLEGWRSFLLSKAEKEEGCKKVAPPSEDKSQPVDYSRQVKQRLGFEKGESAFIGKMNFYDDKGKPTSSLDFKLANNILFGSNIFHGIAMRAFQLVLHMYGPEKCVEVFQSFSNDLDLIEYVLSLFRIQLMVPHALIPENYTELSSK